MPFAWTTVGFFFGGGLKGGRMSVYVSKTSQPDIMCLGGGALWSFFSYLPSQTSLQFDAYWERMTTKKHCRYSIDGQRTLRNIHAGNLITSYGLDLPPIVITPTMSFLDMRDAWTILICWPLSKRGS